MTTITKASAPQRATALGARQFKFVISTGDLDRTGDRIEPRGWQLDDYRRNPVVLFGHRHDVPAIAKASYIAVEGPQLVATATFPPEGLHPLADTVHGLLREGFLTSASVGFQPIQGSPNRDGGTDWSAQILREWSIVNVPALGQAEIARCAATVDRGAVTKWLGADAEPVLMIEDDADEPGVVKPGALLAAAVRTVMARRSLLGRGDQPVVFVLEDDEPAEEETFVVDPEAVRAAVQVHVRQLVDQQVHAAIARLRGRVD